MQVMVFMKATEATENATPPTPEALQAMHDYNEALTAAGILKDQVLGGLLPTKFSKRVRFSGNRRTVTDGPFTETKEVIAGFALWDVKSMEEALEWVMKSPNPMQGECNVEIRPLYSPETWDPA